MFHSLLVICNHGEGAIWSQRYNYLRRAQILSLQRLEFPGRLAFHYGKSFIAIMHPLIALQTTEESLTMRSQDGDTQRLSLRRRQRMRPCPQRLAKSLLQFMQISHHENLNL